MKDCCPTIYNHYMFIVIFPIQTLKKLFIHFAVIFFFFFFFAFFKWAEEVWFSSVYLFSADYMSNALSTILGYEISVSVTF